MKNLLLLAVFSVSSFAFAQDIPNDKVPTEVMTSFKSKFPTVNNTTWEMENDFEYEADFTLNEVKHSALFHKSGKWLETEFEIKTTDLPKPVSSVISREFNGYKVLETEKIETAHDGTLYEVTIEKENKSFELLISSSGKILKKEKENKSSEKE
ncbi:PepSY-like domain-containing protein [Flavobacterium sp. SM15]|uniref:PepSY-like domain-containing protein n=1 Tax=Flavobacterium sp. SM15 TaxID=2908005 RepID=UPI001EDA294A|nr:PepSY-like domain-containing protein [Flavobacterium sp. SM15]MCG2612410.1 PepSY-like domain-containing protein [Flavobacterium sp. SM15]